MIVQITSSRWLPWKYWAGRTGLPWASSSSANRYWAHDQHDLGADEDDARDPEDDHEEAVDLPAEGRDHVRRAVPATGTHQSGENGA